MQNISKDNDHLTNLRVLLTERFDESELRNLAFDLKVDYDILPGSSKGDKARELVAYFHRRDNLGQLIEIGRKSRPDINWDSFIEFTRNINRISPLATRNRINSQEESKASDDTNQLDTIWRN